MAYIERMNIADKIGSKYQRLGTILGLNMATIDSYKQQSFMNLGQTSGRILNDWIERNGHPPNYPLTWKGLYDVLCDIGHRNAAETMRSDLRQKGVHF